MAAAAACWLGIVSGSQSGRRLLDLLNLLPLAPSLSPRQVSPEEYREFLALGHGEIFSLPIDAVVDAPWRCAVAVMLASV